MFLAFAPHVRTRGSGGDELGEARQVDVAAADQDADLLAGHRRHAMQGRRRGQAAGRLDDGLHALGEELHGFDQLGIADGDDVRHQLPDHGEVVMAEVAGLGAVGDGLRHADVDDLPAAQRLLAVVAGLGRDAVDPRARRSRTRVQRRTGQQPTTAEADEQRVDILCQKAGVMSVGVYAVVQRAVGVKCLIADGDGPHIGSPVYEMPPPLADDAVAGNRDA